MVRVTRSKKIEIAEDLTALASQMPLPETPQQAQPLAALPIVSNEMPTMEDPSVEQELKGLKAAYRFAIGGGKKPKKNKNKKAQMSSMEEISTPASPVVLAPWVLPADLKAHIVARGLTTQENDAKEPEEKVINPNEKEATVHVKEVQDETAVEVGEESKKQVSLYYSNVWMICQQCLTLHETMASDYPIQKI